MVTISLYDAKILLDNQLSRMNCQIAPGNAVSLPRGFAPEEVLRDEGALGRIFDGV